MYSLRDIKTALRGEVRPADLAREALRRRRAAARLRSERASIDALAARPARLGKEFRALGDTAFLAEFRKENRPRFWTDPQPSSDSELNRVTALADAVVDRDRWELAGFGEIVFAGPDRWRRDPLTGEDWGLAFHADLDIRPGVADIRVVWELNRFGHAIPLALAYAATSDERYAVTFFRHLREWIIDNPYGRGPNWVSAMEVALRAINVLAAFDIFRRSDLLTEKILLDLLKLLDQHGIFIVENSEFSYISTSNHYLANVVGLYWLGTLLPELEAAAEWRSHGRSEMLAELEKQVLPDGADFESSTGYHKFVTELLLYTLLLSLRTGDAVDERAQETLRRMLIYLRRLLRPDYLIPLIGDADGSQILPIVKHDGDEAAYLVSVGAVYFDDEHLKLDHAYPEVDWLFGRDGTDRLAGIGPEAPVASSCCTYAGSCVMRSTDLYLHFNTSDCGLRGRGSHAHNDALSIDVSAFGRPFIVDPGSYAYGLDLDERHRFRSTRFHSTVSVDGVEQNTTYRDTPFKIGNEARPRMIECSDAEDVEVFSAEHYGYQRLSEPVVHRRTIRFNKAQGYWRLTDEVNGRGHHEFVFSFHLAPGVECIVLDPSLVCLSHMDDSRIAIRVSGLEVSPEMIEAAVSRNYGHRAASCLLSWKVTRTAPFTADFLIVPVCPDEKVEERIRVAADGLV